MEESACLEKVRTSQDRFAIVLMVSCGACFCISCRVINSGRISTDESLHCSGLIGSVVDSSSPLSSSVSHSASVSSAKLDRTDCVSGKLARLTVRLMVENRRVSSLRVLSCPYFQEDTATTTEANVATQMSGAIILIRKLNAESNLIDSDLELSA